MKHDVIIGNKFWIEQSKTPEVVTQDKIILGGNIIALTTNPVVPTPALPWKQQAEKITEFVTDERGEIT